jgi:hypothetical protein
MVVVIAQCCGSSGSGCSDSIGVSSSSSNIDSTSGGSSGDSST